MRRDRQFQAAQLIRPRGGLPQGQRAHNHACFRSDMLEGFDDDSACDYLGDISQEILRNCGRLARGLIQYLRQLLDLTARRPRLRLSSA